MNEKMVALAADRIGISVATLTEETQGGMSIIEVARSRQVDEQPLVEAVMAFRVEVLELGVRYGCHSPERAESMRRFMAERVRSQLRCSGPISMRFRSGALRHLAERAVAA